MEYIYTLFYMDLAPPAYLCDVVQDCADLSGNTCRHGSLIIVLRLYDVTKMSSQPLKQ